MQNNTRIALAVQFGAVFSFSTMFASVEKPNDLFIEQAAALVLEAPRILEVALSPDGHAVLYTVSRSSIKKNQIRFELLLQELKENGAPDGSPRLIATSLKRWTGLTWLADSKRFSVIFEADPANPQNPSGFVTYDVAARLFTPLVLRDAGVSGRPAVRSIPAYPSYRWSNDGRFIAFVAPIEFDQRLNPQVGTLVDSVDDMGRRKGRAGLFVLNVADASLELISPASLHVAGFDWSPDGQSIVLAAATEVTSPGLPYSDLYIFDRSSRSTKILVNQPGIDTNPRWSPDGKTIAFTSQFGDVRYVLGWAAVVPATGGAILRLGSRDSPALRGEKIWLPDSSGFLASGRDMTKRPVRYDLRTRHAEPLWENPTDFTAEFSMSRDGRRWAFTRESMSVPPELFIQDGSDGPARQITYLNRDFALTPLVKVELVSWPNPADGRSNHGMLLTPQKATSSQETTSAKKALPLLVYARSGSPDMVGAGFTVPGAGYHGLELALAARGYAILVPNLSEETFGDHSGRAVYERVIGGVEALINCGVADPERLGIFGQSYGAYVSAYAITRTTRFRAAAVYEGFMDRFGEAVLSVPGSYTAILNRDLHRTGVNDPFEPAEQARLLGESPLFNIGKIETPTLLQYGSRSLADEYGRMMLGGLQRRGIPVEFRIYDEAHWFRQPSAILDNLIRTSDWFDYWVRDMPYPDSLRAAKYDAWKKKQR
jgi:dipeptidyl aminopeptidase/acylaminoacyl peptidase